MNKFQTNELMSNWKNELEICWNKLKYVEINWNVIFSKIILILILKHKRAVPVPLYIFIMSKGIKVGQLSRDATRQSRQLCVMADKWVAAPATPQQLTYAAGGTSILVLSGRRVNFLLNGKYMAILLAKREKNKSSSIKDNIT